MSSEINGKKQTEWKIEETFYRLSDDKKQTTIMFEEEFNRI